MPETAGCLIVTDGVFSMGGDIADLPEICALAQKYGARVMVDDAHGLGVIGEGGRGTASYYGLLRIRSISTWARSPSRLPRSAAIWQPAAAWRTLCATVPVRLFSPHPSRPRTLLRLWKHCVELEAHPELVTRLQENALYMRSLLNERNIKMRPSNGDRIPIIPIYTYEPIPTLTIAKELYERGVYVNSSLPPAAAPHECLLRTEPHGHAHPCVNRRGCGDNCRCLKGV